MQNILNTVRINKRLAISKCESAIASWQAVLDNPEAAEAHDLARRTIESNKRTIEAIRKAPITDWN